MADFYNLADKELFKKYQYLPQEKYRLDLNLPTDATEDEVVTDQGIVNTNAFAGSGGDGFSSTGNMFGEGTPVSPVYGNTYIDVVRREGPDSPQAVEALINAGGTYPGGFQNNEGGFEFTNSFPDTSVQMEGAYYGTPKSMVYNRSTGRFQPSYDYKESPTFVNETLRSTPDVFDVSKRGDPALNAASKMAQGDDPYGELDEEEKQNFFSKLFNKAGQIKAGLPAALRNIASFLNPLSFATNILGSIGGDGPKYGIAGLTDQQKGLYDSLASQGMLYQTPGGMKTFDGKNFSQVDEETYENFFDNKIDRFGSLKNYENYIGEIDPETGKPYTSRDMLRKNYKYNTIGYQELTGEDNLDDARQKQSDAIIKNEMLVREIRKAAAKNKDKDKDKDKDSSPTTGGSKYTGGGAQFTGGTYNTTGGNGSTSGGSGSGTGTGGGDSTGQSTGSSGGYNDGNYCFDPSTPIQMADGSTKKIKNIQLGDNTKGGEVTGVFQFKASDEIHDYKGVTVAGSHYVKEDGKFIMVKDSPLAVKIDKIPVVYSLDTTARRIFIKDIEFADYNGDGVAKNFLTNAGVDLSGFDKEVLRQVENRLI